MENENIMLKVEGLTKTFGTFKALNEANLEVKKGEIKGLIGENGSGKSTMVSIVSGIQPCDSGTFELNGAPFQPKNSTHAKECGVCIILQEMGTFDKLTVAQNLFIGKEKEFTNKIGLLDKKKMITEARKALATINAEYINAEALVSALPFEDRKLVELARAVYANPQILIVDETTTALSKKGRDVLYRVITQIKESGKSVIFISHDIEELIDKCDSLTVLRDGVTIGSLEKSEFDPKTIKSMMVGRELSDNLYRTDYESAPMEEKVLSVENVDIGELQDISFDLYKGEILGLGGLTDCGMHDLGKAIFGLIPLEKGQVVSASGVKILNPSIAMKQKIAYISKNRDQESLMITAEIRDNICCASYDKLRTAGIIFPRKETEYANTWAEKLQVKMGGVDQLVMELSGGNKQKVVMAKWLGFGADIFIMDCPTRGIDVGVKAKIYQLMQDLKSEGKSVILISEEMPEIIGMSDRVITLKNGHLSGTFMRESHMTENDLIESIV